MNHEGHEEHEEEEEIAIFLKNFFRASYAGAAIYRQQVIVAFFAFVIFVPFVVKVLQGFHLRPSAFIRGRKTY